MIVSDKVVQAAPASIRHIVIRLLKAANAKVRRRFGSSSLLISLPDVWHCDPVLSWRPCWSTEVVRGLLGMKPGAFIDVGANMGQSMFDLLCIDSSRKYVGFEPNPVCAGFLSQLVAENQLGNASIVPTALGREAGLRNLYLHRGRAIDDAATLMPDVRPNRAYFVQLVPIWPLDSVYWICTSESPALIKVDAEGAELDILLGMSGLLKRERPPIVCEVLFVDKEADPSASRTRNEKLMRTLHQNRYSVFQIVKTPGTEGVQHLQKVSLFSDAVFSKENMHLCDYVFVPDETIERLSKVFECYA